MKSMRISFQDGIGIWVGIFRDFRISTLTGDRLGTIRSWTCSTGKSRSRE
ncbi:hypothetical protein AFE_1027 [Acidithiobacillus ferrooxidans ATCC 23270]|uniref:Uncharacterized protein n=1 Tax=Acidithiobacillus ferrooxidans (strain ATCC 23270 / DSM 14882 / CIP 104768 / NCIMB 8455) TaxID=243159 RepID=B7J7K2_ACIF2|nr:hypothetical protein AFE_1027 [Acidithiobacillus ferrooxidans ATCC 23270]